MSQFSQEKLEYFNTKLQQVQRKLFINGQLVESQGGKSFNVINPAT